MCRTFGALLAVLIVAFPISQSVAQGVPLPPGRQIPDAQRRSCDVQHSTFVHMGKNWGPTNCLADKPGDPGQPCTCIIEGNAYPGTYSEPE